jgi:archaeal flagellar protein FlaI
MSKLEKNNIKIKKKHKKLKEAKTNEISSIKHLLSSDLNDRNPIIDSYKIIVDKAKVNVEIKKDNVSIIYFLQVPEVNIATQALLNEVRNELISATNIGMKEILDPNAFNDIKKRFMIETKSLLETKLPNLKEDMKEYLVGKLMQDMLGLGEIEFLVNDINLEEIVIPTSKEPIRVYHKKYGWLKTNLVVLREDEIANYSNIIARRVGRQINVLAPLLDAHLISGDRVNSILYPIATKGNTITIRKFARDPYSIIDLINNKTCDIDTVVLIWIAIEYEMNILISGGTASGKTVLLNACMPFIPPNHRVISVEDTRELMLPEFLFWTPLVTRLPNPEGKGGVTMLDLLINSLRMRPDRIILGEMRRQEEAMVLFEAMHTGHSVYATLHADSAAETVNRLTNPPLNIPPNLLKAVNLNVIMFRDRRRGIRRVLQIAEFETGEGRASANIIYRWVPEEDKLKKHSENSRFFEDISRNTGMNQKDIKNNLDEKKNIINFLIKNNVRDLNDFGKVMNLYYSDKIYLQKSISENNINKILGK